jgi:HEAT repeat protein
MNPQDMVLLEQSFDDIDPESRRLAVRRLMSIVDGDAARLLVRALGDENWRVRKEAAAVAPLLEAREAVVPALLGALADKQNIGLRNAAVEALVSVGPDAVPGAIEALHSLDADGRKLAVEVLGGIPDPRVVTPLAGALRDDDPNVRAAAAEELGRAGLTSEEAREEATQVLSHSLSSDELMVKLASLEALRRLDARLPWSVFEPFVRHPLLRRYAIAAASRSREEAALLALVEATGDGSTTVAREALSALGAWLLFESPQPDTLNRARSALRSSERASAFIRARARDGSDARGRSSAIVALGLLQDASDLELIAESLSREDLAEPATVALELFGREATGPLTAMLPRAEEGTRALLLSLLPRLTTEPDASLLAMLREGLNDASSDVALASMKGLSASGDASDLGRMVSLAGHADVRVAMAAAAGLHTLTVRHPGPARMLLRGLSPDGEHAVAGCAMVAALAEAKDGLAIDIDFVNRSLSHADPRVRRVAVDSLAALGGDEVRGPVSFALADEERDVRLAAVRALGRLHYAEPLVALLNSSDDRDVVAATLRALSDADPHEGLAAAAPLVKSHDAAIACAAVEAIGSHTGPARDDALYAALEHHDPEVVKLALSELSRAPDARSLARLGTCLDHVSWEVRKVASELLGQAKSGAAQELLRARLEREKEPIVREALTGALSLRPPPGVEDK